MKTNSENETQPALAVSAGSEIPTPLTDKEAVSVCLNWDNQGDVCRSVVPAELAKKLERKLRCAGDDIVKLRTALNRIAHPASYGTAGMDPKEIARRALILGMTPATCLCKRHYGGVAMRWEPDDDTTGVVLQISNMTAGLSDQLDHAETILCNALPPPHCTPEEWQTIIRGWRDRKHGLSPNNSGQTAATNAAK